MFDSKGDGCGSVSALADLCAWEGSKDGRNGEGDCSERRGWVIGMVAAPDPSLDWGNAASRVLYLRRRLASLDLTGRSRLQGMMEIQSKESLAQVGRKPVTEGIAVAISTVLLDKVKGQARELLP